jgi:hypothetical protein
MAKPNYAYEKRQKELAKKQKKLEKLEQRKAAGHHDGELDTETASEETLEPAATTDSL